MKYLFFGLIGSLLILFCLSCSPIELEAPVEEVFPACAISSSFNAQTGISKIFDHDDQNKIISCSSLHDEELIGLSIYNYGEAELFISYFTYDDGIRNANPVSQRVINWDADGHLNQVRFLNEDFPDIENPHTSTRFLYSNGRLVRILSSSDDRENLSIIEVQTDEFGNIIRLSGVLSSGENFLASFNLSNGFNPTYQSFEVEESIRFPFDFFSYFCNVHAIASIDYRIGVQAVRFFQLEHEWNEECLPLRSSALDASGWIERVISDNLYTWKCHN